MFVFRVFLDETLKRIFIPQWGLSFFFWFNYLTIKFHSAVFVAPPGREDPPQRPRRQVWQPAHRVGEPRRPEGGTASPLGPRYGILSELRES